MPSKNGTKNSRTTRACLDHMLGQLVRATSAIGCVPLRPEEMDHSIDDFAGLAEVDNLRN